MVTNRPFDGIKFVQVQTLNEELLSTINYLKSCFGVMIMIVNKCHYQSQHTLSFIKWTFTKKDEPRKTKTIAVEDVPDHAVDVVVVDAKIVNELREVVEESKEDISEAKGHHEDTSSLEGFTIDTWVSLHKL